ncbi:MAG TPA: hypothetical protein VG014_14105 [Acidimicrobiales bacterium]|nr:hypothetical protein [Acidimicrobiales bacterium]
MTSSGDGGRFEDLDDPSPPRMSSAHRGEVARRVRRVRLRRQVMFSGLAVAVVFGAAFTAVNLRNPVPVTNALGAASGGFNQMFWPTVGSPGPGSAPVELSPLGPSTKTLNDQSNATAGAGAGSGSGVATGAPNSASSGPGFSPGITVAPCPDPTWAGGQYCGPSPQPGNGSGPGGQCSGRETAPPCGPGAVVGTSYPYTLPVRCDGRIIFNGRRWDSDLLPPTNGPDLWVWMRLVPGGQLRFIGPDGTIGFTPDHGKPPPSCRGTP